MIINYMGIDLMIPISDSRHVLGGGFTPENLENLNMISRWRLTQKVHLRLSGPKFNLAADGFGGPHHKGSAWWPRPFSRQKLKVAQK